MAQALVLAAPAIVPALGGAAVVASLPEEAGVRADVPDWLAGSVLVPPSVDTLVDAAARVAAPRQRKLSLNHAIVRSSTSR